MTWAEITSKPTEQSKRENKEMKTIGYIRVSTEKQAKSGLGIADQQRKINLFADLKEIKDLEIKIDAGYSAKNFKRPEIQNIIQEMKQGKIKAVIVAKLDRLTRSLKDLQTFIDLAQKQNVALLSVSEQIDTSNAVGRMVLNIIGTIAQWERETIQERTKGAMKEKKIRGERTGQIPYGYKLAEDNKTLVKDEEEQKNISYMLRLKAKGISYQKIADKLEAKGIKAKSGKKWQKTTVYNIITRYERKELLAA